MSKELALKPEDRQVSIIQNYTNEQIAVIKQHVAVGATNDELIYFLQVCKQQNLDPFSRQIYFVKRSGQMTIQTGIDGYRAMAEQTGRLAGIDEPTYEDGKPYPTKATITVWKFVQGQKVAFTASARWSEYFPGDKMGFMWKKMPYLMLGKVAEALALRKAFPKNLGGVYTEDEIAREIPTGSSVIPDSEPTEITKHQIDKINYLIKERGKDLAKMLKYYNRDKVEELTHGEAEQAIKLLESSPVAKKQTPTAPAIEQAPVAPEAVDGEVVEEMPAAGLTMKNTREQLIAEIQKISKEKRQFLSPLVAKYGKQKVEDLTKEELLFLYEILIEQPDLSKKKEGEPTTGIPGDVCQLINWYEGIDTKEWPQVIFDLKTDADEGKFRGYGAYPGLKEEIEKLPKG